MSTFTPTQHTYRFLEDDNSDPDLCTPIEDADTAATWDADTNLMVRIGIRETGSKSDSFTPGLSYCVNSPTGTFNPVTAISSNVRCSNGTPSDAAATTEAVCTVPGSGDWFNGSYDEGDGACTNIATFPKDDYTELQWCVQLRSAELSNNDVIYFRVYDRDGAPDTVTYSINVPVTVTLGPTQVQKYVGLDAALKAIITKSVGTDAYLAHQYQKLVGLDSFFKARVVKSVGTDVYLVPPVRLKASTYIGASGEDTVFRTTANGGMNPPSGLGSGDFSTGRVQDDENPTDAISADSTGFTELEWNIEGLLNGTYKFRLTKGGTPVTLYGISNPQLTITAGNTYQKTVALDVALKGTVLKSVGTDAVLKAIYTKAVNLDAALANVITKLVALEALLKKIDTKDVTLDAVLLERITKDVGLDAVLKAEITKLVGTDAVLVDRITKTVNLDALLKEIVTLSVGLDALLKDTFTKVVDLTAILAQRTTKDVGLDVFLKGVYTKAVALDTYLIGTVVKLVALEAVLQQQGITKLVGLDAVLVERVTKSVNLDAVLKDIVTNLVNLDAVLMGRYTKSVNLDAYLSSTAQYQKYVLLEALLQGTLTKSVGLDAVLQTQGITKYVGLDAVLQAVQSKLVGLSAVLQETLTKTVGLDAVLMLQSTKDVNLEAVLSGRYLKLVGLDAYLESGITGIAQQRSLFRFIGSRMHGRVN